MSETTFGWTRPRQIPHHFATRDRRLLNRLMHVTCGRPETLLQFEKGRKIGQIRTLESFQKCLTKSHPENAQGVDGNLFWPTSKHPAACRFCGLFSIPYSVFSIVRFHSTTLGLFPSIHKNNRATKLEDLKKNNLKCFERQKLLSTFWSRMFQILCRIDSFSFPDFGLIFCLLDQATAQAIFSLLEQALPIFDPR